MDGYYQTLSFDLTEAHITLLRKANVTWDNCEYGAPGIDTKRPYGNSSGIEIGIANLLGWDLFVDQDEEAHLTREQFDRARQIHEETLIALQIVLRTGSFATGTYTRPDVYGSKWEPVVVEEAY